MKSAARETLQQINDSCPLDCAERTLSRTAGAFKLQIELMVWSASFRKVSTTNSSRLRYGMVQPTLLGLEIVQPTLPGLEMVQPTLPGLDMPWYNQLFQA